MNFLVKLHFLLRLISLLQRIIFQSNVLLPFLCHIQANCQLQHAHFDVEDGGAAIVEKLARAEGSLVADVTLCF